MHDVDIFYFYFYNSTEIHILTHIYVYEKLNYYLHVFRDNDAPLWCLLHVFFTLKQTPGGSFLFTVYQMFDYEINMT